MEPLTFPELEEAFKNGQQVVFHPDFGYEAWKDGENGPLTLTHVVRFAGLNFVGYRCMDENCSACTSTHISHELCGHQQLVKENGFHIYDKVEFIETKKSTITKVLPNPVFVFYKAQKNGLS